MPPPSAEAYPTLRAVDVQPSHEHRGAFDLFDPSGIAQGRLTVSNATLSIISRMDGQHDRPSIQVDFLRRTGRLLFSDELDQLIEQLDEALFLEGPRFEAHFGELKEAYRRAPSRLIRDVNGFGASVEQLGAYLDEIIGGRVGGAQLTESNHEKVVGIIAPHLDYARGGPCYAAAYGNLAQRTTATRFVILGTNHFGRSRSVVGTQKDFETPFGTVPHDGEFMGRLASRCGHDLCEDEYDHVREHSIELQVLLLKRLLVERPFKIAAYLCPDPCGPTGTAPSDGCGVDLKNFAVALREEIQTDDTPTCLIAGADLSHIGRFFQDDRDLDDENLKKVEALDRAALTHVESGDEEEFRLAVSERNNNTNICSVGCIYALTSALGGRAEPRLLRYHQALTREHENCVTCAAMEFTRVD